MLRNSLKIALCGLTILILCACTNNKPLLVHSPQKARFSNIKIKADPYLEYLICGKINDALPLYIEHPENYLINITISEKSSSAVYTQEQVAKEQLRVVALIEIYDRQYNAIGSKLVDAFSTYEVCDDIPFSVLSSKKQARSTVAQELANAIVFAIRSLIK